jgi:hypothetical protein
MSRRLAGAFLVASSALLVLSAVMHTRAFGKAAVAASSLAEFYGNALKALWLIDSATMLVLAVLFTVAAVKPAAVSGLGLIMLAVIPAATAALLYTFIGSFLPAHILLATALMIVTAGLLRTADKS